MNLMGKKAAALDRGSGHNATERIGGFSAHADVAFMNGALGGPNNNSSTDLGVYIKSSVNPNTVNVSLQNLYTLWFTEP